MARRRVPPRPSRPGPAAHGSPGPVGGRGPTGSCAGTSPEPALAKAGGGGRFDHAPQHRGGPPRTQRSSVVNAATARQRRGHQRQQLVSRVRPPRRIPEVEVTVNEFTQAQQWACVAGRSSPALLTRRWSSKAMRMRSGWWRGSIFWVLVLWDRFFAAKPLSQKHLLAASGR